MLIIKNDEPSLVVVCHGHTNPGPPQFGSLEDLYGISGVEGYQGGLRLMQATCKRFFQYCVTHGIAIARRNFALSYDTNIPRQARARTRSVLRPAYFFFFFIVVC